MNAARSIGTHWVGGVPQWPAPETPARPAPAPKVGPIGMEVSVWLRAVGCWKSSAEVAAALGLRMQQASSTLRNLSDNGYIERSYIAERAPRYRALQGGAQT